MVKTGDQHIYMKWPPTEKLSFTSSYPQTLSPALRTFKTTFSYIPFTCLPSRFCNRFFVCWGLPILITKLPILRQQRGTRCPYKVRSHPEVVTDWDAVSLSYKMPARSGRRKVRSPSNPPLERSQAELNQKTCFFEHFYIKTLKGKNWLQTHDLPWLFRGASASFFSKGGITEPNLPTI